jgi:glycosyltransferase involved in cell wall biosynthesis
LRILLSHYLLDDDTPPARIVHALRDEFQLLGHEVAIHRSAGPPRPVHRGGSGQSRRRLGLVRDKVWFAKAIARNFPMLRRDLRAVQGFRPDVVVVRQDSYCASMALACRLKGVPYVLYADAPVAYESRIFESNGRWHPPALVEAIEQSGLSRSSAVTTMSHPAAAQLGLYRVDRPIHVIPNGVHPDRYPQLSDEERRQRRAALGIDAPVVLGFQGTFRAFHGIDRLRELMLGTAQRPDIHWLLIGDGPERSALEASVSGRVAATFLGRRPHETMGELLSLVDIAVAPHQFVNGNFYFSPLKILEYAASGCAIVASHQGDIPWLLDEGRAGIVLEAPEVSAWLGAVDRLLDDSTLRRSLGQAARRHVLDHFTWKRVAEQYEDVLQSAVSSRDFSPTLRVNHQ